MILYGKLVREMTFVVTLQTNSDLSLAQGSSYLWKYERLCRERRVYLEDPGLLFEVLILVRLSIRKVVNLDAMFIDLIQNLTETETIFITCYDLKDNISD